MKGRRLIYHFYVAPDYETNPAYKMHFACLKEYSHLFDSAKFFISVDYRNRDIIADVASKIVSCGFVENTEFIVVDNDIYREAETFKREIADRLEDLDGLTFFAHTKGISNISMEGCDNESILMWIFGCYYLSLSDMDEVHNQMQVYQPFCQRYFYGSFLKNVPSDEGGGTKYGPEYEGSFFWINCVPLFDYMKEHSIQIPRNFGRFYAERFPGDTIPLGEHIGSYRLRYYLGDISMYNRCSEIVEALLFKEDSDRFFDEYKKLREKYGI